MGKKDFCCAIGCSNNRKRNPELQFYRIPKRSDRRKAWIKRIRRKNWKPSDSTRLCSAHFVGGVKSNNPLSKSYTPSIFCHSHNKRTPRKSRNSLKTNDDAEKKPKRRRLVQKSKEIKGRPKQEVPCIDDHNVWGASLSSDNGLKEHDYCRTQLDLNSMRLDQSVTDELKRLHQKVAELQEQNDCLKSRCLNLDNLKNNDKQFQTFTGFPNYSTFKALFEYLDCIALDKKKNWRGSSMKAKAYSTRQTQAKLTLEEEFFMVVVRLRLGLTLTDLALRFGVSESTISRIFTTWINLLYFHLKDLCQMPEYCEELGKPEQFAGFPDLKVIVDCTEIFTQKPSSLKANKEIYSNYKSHATFKFLVAINACAAIVYISRGWGGRVSDKHITASSVDFIATLQEGDEVMADRGFDVGDVLGDRGVRVTIPDFKGQGRSQLMKSEGKRSEKIAEARIHVERAIQRIKTYHILDNEVRLSMAHLAEQIFTVCGYLVNFQSPIIK